MEQDRSLFQVEVNPATKEYFLDASKWGRTVAIIGFCGIGLFIILFLFVGNQLSLTIGEEFNSNADGLAVLIVILLIVLGIIGTLCYFLYKGASRIRTGIEHGDQLAFNEGIAYFRNYFVMLGILSLITLVFELFKFL